jgi:hypothetical protein
MSAARTLWREGPAEVLFSKADEALDGDVETASMWSIDGRSPTFKLEDCCDVELGRLSADERGCKMAFVPLSWPFCEETGMP